MHAASQTQCTIMYHALVKYMFLHAHYHGAQQYKARHFENCSRSVQTQNQGTQTQSTPSVQRGTEEGGLLQRSHLYLCRVSYGNEMELYRVSR